LLWHRPESPMKFESRNIIKTDLSHYAFGYGDKENLFKIMFWDDKEKSHFTILINGYKKELDVHKTINRENGIKEYESILKISFYTLFRFLALHSKVQFHLLRKYWFSNSVNIGKLIRLDAMLLPMDNPRNETLFIEKRRSKKFRVRDTININDLEGGYISPAEIHEAKDDSFNVYLQKRGQLKMIGTIIRHNRTLYYLSEVMQRQMAEQMTKSAIEITKSLNFPYKNQLLALLEK
jgi:hypothetical protein